MLVRKSEGRWYHNSWSTCWAFIRRINWSVVCITTCLEKYQEGLKTLPTREPFSICFNTKTGCFPLISLLSLEISEGKKKATHFPSLKTGKYCPLQFPCYRKWTRFVFVYNYIQSFGQANLDIEKSCINQGKAWVLSILAKSNMSATFYAPAVRDRLVFQFGSQNCCSWCFNEKRDVSCSENKGLCCWRPPFYNRIGKGAASAICSNANILAEPHTPDSLKTWSQTCTGTHCPFSN